MSLQSPTSNDQEYFTNNSPGLEENPFDTPFDPGSGENISAQYQSDPRVTTELFHPQPTNEVSDY